MLTRLSPVDQAGERFVSHVGFNVAFSLSFLSAMLNDVGCSD